jgi:hypothetical protein
MMTRLVPGLLVLTLLVAGAAWAEPCAPDAGGAVASTPGAKPCEERSLPGVVAVAPEQIASPPPPPLAAPNPAPVPLGDNAPSLLAALARLIGAVLVIAVLMAACVVGYRRLTRREGTPKGILAWATGWVDDAGPDAIRVASRRSLGARESVAVIHAGGERFLVGITSGQVSLLARLDAPTPEAEPDFTEALTRATAPAPRAEAQGASSAADALRAAVERSRDRLGRLAHLSVVPRDGRA